MSRPRDVLSAACYISLAEMGLAHGWAAKHIRDALSCAEDWTAKTGGADAVELRGQIAGLRRRLERQERENA